MLVSPSWAGLTKFEVHGSNKFEFTLKEACSSLGERFQFLVDKKSTTEIDCTGTTLNLSSFCETKMKGEEGYMRGYWDDIKKSVICQRGRKVVVSFSCAKNEQSLCEDSEISCHQLKLKLAKTLKLHHAAIIGDDYLINQQKSLECVFLSEQQNSTLHDDEAIEKILPILF